MNELHFWSIDGLSNAFNPTFKINILIDRQMSPNTTYWVKDLAVIMGQNNTFLLTRKIIVHTSTRRGRFMRDVTDNMFFEWTKFKFSPYDTMDQFYASLTD